MKYPTTVPYSWGIRKTMRPLGLNDRLVFRILGISLICNKSTMYNITLLMQHKLSFPYTNTNFSTTCDHTPIVKYRVQL